MDECEWSNIIVTPGTVTGILFNNNSIVASPFNNAEDVRNFMTVNSEDPSLNCSINNPILKNVQTRTAPELNNSVAFVTYLNNDKNTFKIMKTPHA